MIPMNNVSSKKIEQELQALRLVLESFSARLSGEKDYSLIESKKLIYELIEKQ